MTRFLRILRHLLADARAVRRVLPAAAMARIGQAIAAGEARHDGEVRFCIEAGLPWSYLRRGARARERAIMLFSKLRVWDTERNTGVLLYVLLADQAVEVVADRGIARAVPQAEWNAVCGELAAAFRSARPQEGILQALEHVHGLLAAHFPPQGGNPNELADAPVVL